jgi:hypothetical protein
MEQTPPGVLRRDLPLSDYRGAAVADSKPIRRDGSESMIAAIYARKRSEQNNSDEDRA